ncbi:MAG: conjugal transfer protein TraD [Candidatus Paracaedimonas acanthamoebae]|uniref:Conjugal transfer protein TraD n=1 Tax=Candidatus Paracaedimonas acanthamoebae TaxID=244581 RepID=A0A8J7TUX1_9PROT|nr:conjugal transfer protein TraD [Holosporales bacterium]MBN9413587.1 conjugal transfer protein TraD [Candidatus Paracaedimonas acanthamoebae]
MQQLNKNSWGLEHLKRKSKRIKISDRKAENRTKIQLGGLILKSGLASFLEIEPGKDLQLDPIAREKATTLLGALLYVTEHLNNDIDGALKQECSHLGMKAMVQQFLRSKDHKSFFKNDSI